MLFVSCRTLRMYRPRIPVCKQSVNLFYFYFAASVGVRWMIGVTEINKGSTYGNNDIKQKRK